MQQLELQEELIIIEVLETTAGFSRLSFAKIRARNSSARLIGLIYTLGDYDEAIKNILEANNLNPKSSLIISQLSQTFRP